MIINELIVTGTPEAPVVQLVAREMTAEEAAAIPEEPEVLSPEDEIAELYTLLLEQDYKIMMLEEGMSDEL